MSVERNSISFDPSTSSKWRHAVRLAGNERAHDLHRNAVYLDDEDDEDDDEDE
jgi:hypothetical protein